MCATDYDAVPPTAMHNGGQRLCTLLVYLNDVEGGGCTAFRDLRAGGTDASGAPVRLVDETVDSRQTRLQVEQQTILPTPGQQVQLDAQTLEGQLRTPQGAEFG